MVQAKTMWSPQSAWTLTPTQIKSIESIGEWEFLAVSDEEIVDTVSHGFFGDSELIRIYYGTLRMGIDLRQARKGWIRLEGDTVCADLPPVRLLGNEFIDEARTSTSKPVVSCVSALSTGIT